jgi:phenylacetate-CoA ligase
MSKWQDAIYAHLPVAVQNLACTYSGIAQRRLRYGGDFPALLDWLEESQWWSAARIEEFQNEQLQKLMQHAYDTVPYYRRMFDERNLKPKDFESIRDLAKLPVLSKEDIHRHRDALLSRQFSKKDLVFAHTGGTTGKSLHFYRTARAVQFSWAVWWRHRRRFGIEFDSPYATFTGLAAVPLNQEKPPYWRENRAMHQTVFTMHHVTPSRIEAIVGRLNRGGFEYYAGYPSILFNLASLIREAGLEITAPPKIVFTGAENLYENQRQVISEVLKCPVTDQYGFSEGCGNASRCTEDVFHEDFEYGILECGEPMETAASVQRGPIIATGFANYGMPLIRYKVGDSGAWKSSVCACGRRSKVLTQIVGRLEDYVVTPEGRRIMRFDYVFKDTQNIREAQVVQREPGSICMRIVRRPGYSVKDEKLLREETRNTVSAKLKVEFEYVEEIEREANGKMRAVRSFLDPIPNTQDVAVTDETACPAHRDR